MNRTLSITVLCLCIAFFPLTAGGRDTTYWQHDPSEPGDWFDPANWTAGVPSLSSRTYVDNGGTAQISGGLAETESLWVVGSASARLELSGGQLHSTHQYMAGSGTGVFVQSGGMNRVDEVLRLGHYFHSQGRYELIAGQLWADEEHLGYHTYQHHGSGLFIQTGGTNTTGYLRIASTGRYDFFAGALHINGGLKIAGKMDCGGNAVTVNVSDSSLVDLSGAYIFKAGHATLSVGANSLTIYEPGLPPTDWFGKFSTQGMLHEAGQTLVVGAGQGFGGRGEINDHVQCTGTITANAGSGISLNDGLAALAGAVVDLGSGRLVVNDYVGGLSGQASLSCGSMRMGYLLSSGSDLDRYEVVAAFPQSGGTVTIEDTLLIGYNQGSTGVYPLTAGTLRSGNLVIGGSGTGHFVQTGGTNTVGWRLTLAAGGMAAPTGTYELRGGELEAGSEWIGESGTATFIQTGGTNTIHDDLVMAVDAGRATYELTNGHLRSENLLIGSSGTGHFLQTGGSNTVEGYLGLGLRDEASGTYELSDGDLRVGGDERIGYFGTAAFVQTGGTNTARTLAVGLYGGTSSYTQINGTTIIDERTSIGTHRGAFGRYELKGGELISGDSLSIGPFGTGEFVQTGGTNTVNESLSVGTHDGSSGTYELKGGELISGDSLSIGPFGTGEFVQTGGTNTVNERLSLGTYDGSSGTYELKGGELVSGDCLDIGSWGTGNFLQTGGTNTVNESLSLGTYDGSSATYTIASGSLRTKDMAVGWRGSASFNITGSGAHVTISGQLCFGPNSMFTAVDGSNIQMTGGSFRNRSTDPAALAGLGNLTLICEGGAEGLTIFEVAGEDRGADLAGYFENFALDTLQLGDGDVGRVQLVDWYDNQPGWEGAEALYVENLIIGPGSGLDLNGLKLYFLNGGQPKQLLEGDADLSGSVDLPDLTLLANNWGESPCGWGEGDFTGDRIVDLSDLLLLANNWQAGGGQGVPEPAALGLIAAGACLPLLRRSRIRRGRGR